MYSLPTSVTLAALTIASAASTEPISPRVSISPKASLSTARGAPPPLALTRRRRFAALPLRRGHPGASLEPQALARGVSCRDSSRLPEVRQLHYHPRTPLHFFMHSLLDRRAIFMGAVAWLVCSAAATSCRRAEQPAPAVATPTVTLNHDKAPLG